MKADHIAFTVLNQCDVSVMSNREFRLYDFRRRCKKYDILLKISSWFRTINLMQKYKIDMQIISIIKPSDGDEGESVGGVIGGGE